MWSLGVVVVEVLGDRLLPGGERPGRSGETLILERAIEPLEVGVVVRLPDTGVPMGKPLDEGDFGESL